jgi:hypothetical protein
MKARTYTEYEVLFISHSIRIHIRTPEPYCSVLQNKEAFSLNSPETAYISFMTILSQTRCFKIEIMKHVILVTTTNIILNCNILLHCVMRLLVHLFCLRATLSSYSSLYCLINTYTCFCLIGHLQVHKFELCLCLHMVNVVALVSSELHCGHTRVRFYL